MMVHAAAAVAEKSPPGFGESPLQGKTSVEVFSGLEAEGGAMLSKAWEAAGGTAIRYDERIDEEQDFMSDSRFWADHLRNPKDAYHFEIPCHHMSAAHTTPVARSVANPYGNETDEETAYYNKMAEMMSTRMLELAAAGAMILLEQPLLSHLLHFREIAGIVGAPGFILFRADDCMSGTPYKKPRAWMTTCPNIASIVASVCCHPEPHPEQLVGHHTRRSAAYPKELVIKLVEGAISALVADRSLTNTTAVESSKLYLEHSNRRRRAKGAPAFSGDVFESWVAAGQAKLSQIRHCTKVATATAADQIRGSHSSLQAGLGLPSSGQGLVD